MSLLRRLRRAGGRRPRRPRAASFSSASAPAPPPPPPEPMPRYLDDFRTSLRRWVDREILPHVSAWDEAGRVPRAVFRQAGEVGLLGVGYPEEYGGLGNDPRDLSVMLMVCEELCRAGSGGLRRALRPQHLAAPDHRAEATPSNNGSCPCCRGTNRRVWA